MTKVRFLLVFLFSISVCGATTVTVFFTALPSVFENNTYNGFATATINGIPNQYLICDDYTDRTYMPSSENLIYDYSNLNPTPLEHARYVSPGGPTPSDVTKYEEAAVLLWQLTQLGASATPTAITDFQYAIWNLFSPSDPATFRPNQTALQNTALGLVNSGQPWLTTVYQELAIYTPTAKFGTNQEFLQLTQNTPEPAMVGLLAGVLGVVGLVGQIRRRRQI
jgi:hypothetical protein